MGMRFKILASLYLIMMLVLHQDGGSDLGGIADVFVGLGTLLVLAVVALWPAQSQGDRVDRALGGSNWADKVEFETVARD